MYLANVKCSLKVVTVISILSVYSAIQRAEVAIISDKPLSDIKCVGVYKPLIMRMALLSMLRILVKHSCACVN